MGLLDKLPFGGKKTEPQDDEEELKENIEKIRQKIQDEGGGPRPGGAAPGKDGAGAPPAPRGGGEDRPPRGGAPKPPAPGGQDERDQEDMDTDRETGRPPRGGAPEPATHGGPAPEDADESARPTGAPGRSGRDGPGREQDLEPPRESPDRGEMMGGADDEEDTGLPEPPELKELDLPDVEEGPLFVEVDTFRTTLQALADMRRVSRELDDHVGSMEGTLDEDRETADGMTDLLDRAEETTRRMRQLLHR